MKNTGLNSVKDLARDLNTTPQTIYKYVNRLEDKYITKIGNVIHITPKGVEIIKAEYDKNNPTENTESKAETNQEVYNLLTDQIKIKDKQIEALLKTNESLNERIREINHLIALERKEKALQGNTEPLDLTKEDFRSKLSRTQDKKAGILERIRYLFTGKRNNVT